MRITVEMWSGGMGKPDGKPSLIGTIIWDEETNEITTNPSDHAGLAMDVAAGQRLRDPDTGRIRTYSSQVPEDRRFFVENLWQTYRGSSGQAHKPVIEEFL